MPTRSNLTVGFCRTRRQPQASATPWGAGAELRLWGNWTGKLEYLHVDVGGTTNVSQQSAPPSFGPIALTTTTSRIKDDIVRLGLTYRLGLTGAGVAPPPTICF